MGTELGNPWKNSATVTSRARSDFGAPRSVTGSRKSGRAMRLDRDRRDLRSGLGGRAEGGGAPPGRPAPPPPRPPRLAPPRGGDTAPRRTDTERQFRNEPPPE